MMKKIIQFVASKIRNRKIISADTLIKVKILNKQIKYYAAKAADMLDKASEAGDPYICMNIKYKDAMEAYNNLSTQRRKLIGI